MIQHEQCGACGERTGRVQDENSVSHYLISHWRFKDPETGRTRVVEPDSDIGTLCDSCAADMVERGLINPTGDDSKIDAAIQAKIDSGETVIEEGGSCPWCGESMELPPVENCSCHINPPCSQCTRNRLTCSGCGWEYSPTPWGTASEGWANSYRGDKTKRDDNEHRG